MKVRCIDSTDCKGLGTGLIYDVRQDITCSLHDGTAAYDIGGNLYPQSKFVHVEAYELAELEPKTFATIRKELHAWAEDVRALEYIGSLLEEDDRDRGDAISEALGKAFSYAKSKLEYSMFLYAGYAHNESLKEEEKSTKVPDP
jgi:hypothetical protein